MLFLLACASSETGPPVHDPVESPALSVSPHALDFGTIALGASATETVTLTNSGTAGLTLTAAVEHPGFAVADPLPVLPGESLDLAVTFAPTERGRVTSSLVLSPDSLAPVAVALTGEASSWSLDADPSTLAVEVQEGCTVDETVALRASGADFTLTEVSADDVFVVPSVDLALPAEVTAGDRFDLLVSVTGGSQRAIDATIHTLSPEIAADVLHVTGTVIPRDTYTQTFIVPDPSATDILVALDGEAYAESAAIQDQVAAFVLAAATDERRVAVAVGDDGCVPGVWIDAATADPESALAAMLAVESGETAAAGLALADSALANDTAGGCNEGLLRADSPLAVVGVTDGPDESTYGWSTYLAIFQALKASPADVAVHAVAPDFPTGCLDHDPGVGWYEATVASGGLYLSNCATDWADTLFEGIAGHPWDGQVELEEWPDAETISVYLDGVGAKDGWTYSTADRAVEFDADAQPAPGTVVTVTYALNCP